MDENQPRYNKSKVEEHYTNESFLIYANGYGSKLSTAKFKFDQNCGGPRCRNQDDISSKVSLSLCKQP